MAKKGNDNKTNNRIQNTTQNFKDTRTHVFLHIIYIAIYLYTLNMQAMLY